MAVTQQQNKKSVLWQALKELEFISVFFSWLFLLMSRLAEPFMLLSAMYIIIEAGITQAANNFLHNLSVGTMITAPEVILPGAFILAAQARTQGKETRPLFCTCCLFVLLTLTTLLSLFVFHFSQDIINIIMFARCATGIGYSILVRIVTHTQQDQVQPPLQDQQSPPPTAPEITSDQLALIVEQLKQFALPTIAETVENHLGTMKLTAVSSSETTEKDHQETDGKPQRPETTKRTKAGDREYREPKPKTTPPTRRNITSITRKLVTDEEVVTAYVALKEETGRVTADALKGRVGIGKKRACDFLRAQLKEEASA